MRNLLFSLRFNGAAYHGWQMQQNAVSVQQVFSEALENVLHEKVDVKGCSRTDAGVHANQFCASVKTSRTIQCERLVFAVNHFLPPDIAAWSCREVPLSFHARYDCRGKEYVYLIWNARVRDPFLYARALHDWYPLDAEQLNRAAQAFVGYHDFTSFCTLDKRQGRNFCRTVTHASVRRDGDLVRFTVAADGFLYNMVRILVGTLLYVAQGKLSGADLPRIFEARDRAAAGPTAPPQGLYLNRVFYDEGVL